MQWGFLKSIFHCCSLQPGPKRWGDAGYPTGAQCSRAALRFAEQQGGCRDPWGRVFHPPTETVARARAWALAGCSKAELGSGCRAIPLGKSNTKGEKVNLGNRSRSRTLARLPAKGTRLRANLGRGFGHFRAARSANTPRTRGQKRVLTHPGRVGGGWQLPATGAGVRQGTPVSLLGQV